MEHQGPRTIPEPAPLTSVLRAQLWPIAGLVVAILLVYGPALRAGFIWDDDVHFAANPRMNSWSGLLDIWTSRWALYYPLTSTTFWLLRRVIGLAPWAYHLFAILMHAGAVVLLWRVLLGLRIRGAWLGAVLFALHPVQVESVAWVSELKNTQSLLFLLLSLRALVASGLLPDNQLRDRNRYIESLIWFFAALMSKSAVATFPGVLLILLWWRRSWRGGVRWTLPYFLPSLLFGVWTIWEQRYNSGALGFEWAVAMSDRLVTAGRLVMFYLSKLAWPEPLIFLYPSLHLSASEPRSWMPLVALTVVLLGFAINARDWGRPLLAAALSYLVLLFPVLGFFNVYFMRYAEASDHFQYLASIAPLAVVGAVAQQGLDWFRRHAPRGEAWLRAVIALGVVGFALQASRHVMVFKNNETLWRDTVAKNPGAWMAQNNLGLLYLDRGEWGPAEFHFRAALAANPRHYEALSNLGIVQFHHGDLDGAQASFEKALALQPRLVHALVNLGSVHEKRGQRADAEHCYREAVSMQPDLRDAQARLAALCENTGRVAEAIEHYRRALQASTPDVREHAKFIQQRAALMLAQGRWSDALLYLNEADHLQPGDAQTKLLLETMEKLQRTAR